MAIKLRVAGAEPVRLGAAENEMVRLGTGEGEQGTRNYDELYNKPQINGVTLEGDKSSAELGVQGTDKLVQTVSASSAADEYPSAKALWNQAAKYAKCKRFVGTSVPGGVFTLSSNNIADIYNAQTSGGQIVFIFDEAQKITYRVNYCFIDHTDPAHERIVVYAVADHVDTTQGPNYGIAGEYQDALYIKAAATSQMLIPITRELQEKLTFDNVPTLLSNNPVKSGGVYSALAGKISGGDVPVYEQDPTVPSWAKTPSKPSYTAAEVGALPDTTVIPTAVSQLNNDSGFVDAAGASAAAPVQSVNGQTGAVSGLQEALTFDTVPTESSTNPVTSGGIYNALEAQETIVVTIPNPNDVSTITPTADELAAAVIAQKTIKLYFSTAQKATAPVAVQAITLGGIVGLLLQGRIADMDENAGFVNSTGYLGIMQTGSAWSYYAAGTSSYVPPQVVSAFNNDVGYITGAEVPSNETDPTVPAWAKEVSKPTYTPEEVGAQPAGNYAAAAADDPTASALAATAIPFAQVDATSTSTVFTATVPGITEYRDGVSFWLRNGVVTSASGFTVNINGLGAKKVYNNMAPTTQDTTLFNVSYTFLFVYFSWLDDGAGGFFEYRGYDANTNTIGYQVRTNSGRLPMKSITYRYRLLFTAADGKHFVPATNSTSTNATASRTVCQDPIDPHGSIFYYGTTASVAAGALPSAAYLWQQYTLSLGYSFNRTGAALVLTLNEPVYVKATPQADGSAIIDATTPYVQTLPTTADGSIYIFLGYAYSATNIELQVKHPVYHFYNGAIRLWTGPV